MSFADKHTCHTIYRSEDEPTPMQLLQKPKHGKRQAGNLLSPIDLLKQDTGLEELDIKTAMLDSSIWRAIEFKISLNQVSK